MIAGHPFKGGVPVSIGHLQHPEIRRFNLGTGAQLFVPPNPEKTVHSVKAAPYFGTFGDAMQQNFGQQVLNVSNPACRKMLENYKTCFENHKDKLDPSTACAFYSNGLQRLSCAK
jgi:hypothetical protein